MSAKNAAGGLRPKRKHNKIASTRAKLVQMPICSNFRELVTTVSGRKAGAGPARRRALRATDRRGDHAADSVQRGEGAKSPIVAEKPVAESAVDKRRRRGL